MGKRKNDDTNIQKNREKQTLFLKRIDKVLHFLSKE